MKAIISRRNSESALNKDAWGGTLRSADGADSKAICCRPAVRRLGSMVPSVQQAMKMFALGPDLRCLGTTAVALDRSAPAPDLNLPKSPSSHGALY